MRRVASGSCFRESLEDVKHFFDADDGVVIHVGLAINGRGKLEAGEDLQREERVDERQCVVAVQVASFEVEDVYQERSAVADQL